MPEAFDNFLVMRNVLSETQEIHAYDLATMSSTYTLSPANSSIDSQGNSNAASPMSINSSSPQHLTSYTMLSNATVMGQPHITILEQPVEKFRFRYKSEMMGTHGSLVGASSVTSRKKHAPTVQLHNFPTKAIIRCTLVTSDEMHRTPHAHRLVRREGNKDCDDPHHIEVSSENGYMASFHGMGIIHTAKKHIKDELIRKMRIEALEKVRQKNPDASLSIRDEAQIKADAETYQKYMNLNSVALCFQAFALGKNDIMTPITEPVYSHAINNLKSALTGELKICRIDKYTSSCEGGEEVFILVEKVGKKNIKVKFFELNEDDHEVWADYARFSELDVHHQYAIVFRTPPYKDFNITSPKEVFIQLERPSDADCSEPIKFTYKPSDRNMGRKRARISNSNSSELMQALCIPPTENKTASFYNSKELTDILLEGCTSNNLKDFDCEKYLELLAHTEEDNLLVTDGPSKKSTQNDITFAKDTLLKAVKILKLEQKNMKQELEKLLKDRSTYGDSPLHAALRYNLWEVAKYILIIIGTDPCYKSLVDIQNSSGKTPLHYAILQNQPEIAKVLLMLGANPNACDDHGCSPLHAAVRIPEAGECVDALLAEKITSAEAHTDSGWTPLHLAAEAGSYHAVRSLIRAGVDVNSADMLYGRTVLHIAVEGGHKNIVEYLLKETKIDINKRNFSGNTALHSATVIPGTLAAELCKLLMAHGADPSIPNNNRESDNSGKDKVGAVGVKVEVDSEDETMSESVGQTSFDLASQKPEILQVLKGQSEEIQKEGETDTFQTKVEIMDSDSEACLLRREHKNILASILDRTEGWKKLAKNLNVDYFDTFRESSSPSTILLNYIELNMCGMTLAKLQELLQGAGETEAAEFISEVSSLSS